MTTTTGSPPSVPAPVVELRGEFGDDLPAYARDVVTHVLEVLARRVHGARLRIIRHPDPARERPVTASVLVVLDHGRVHAHVTAERPREAVDLLADRLRRRVVDTRRRRAPKLRHPSARDAAHPAAAIVRHDVVHAVPIDVGEAAAILVDLDQDVHLFLERDTGAPAVVYRGGPTGLRAAFAGATPEVELPGDVTVSGVPARRLSVELAADHLALSGLPFLFFADPDGVGRLLHHDEDGRTVLVDVTDAGPGTVRPARSGPSDRRIGVREP